MATGSPAAEQTTDLLQKLSLDPQTNTAEVPEATNKKPSPIKCGSVDGEVPSGPMSFREQSITPSLPDYMDPNLCYLPNGYPSATYYCPGFDGRMNEWEDYPRYVGPDGVEMPPPGVYGDNGSLMYQHGYGYAPYGAYSPAGSPVPTMGHDGQLYGPQHYQFPAPYYVPPTPSDAMYSHNQVATPQGEVSTSVAADQAPLSVEKGNGNAKGSENVNINGPVPLRPGYSNSFQAPNGSYGRGMLQGGVAASGYQDPGFRYDGLLFSDGHQRTMTSSASSTTIPSSRNQNLHTLPHLTGLQPSTASGIGPGFVNSMYPSNRLSGQFGNMLRTGSGFASNGFDFRANGRGWLPADNKYRSRGQGNGIYGYGNESADGLNELNRGPRAGRFKNQKGIGPNITIAVRGQNLSSNGRNDESVMVPDRDQYNQPGFSIEYSDAKFFVIKSYSEDDIHRSIKYGVWASTPNGNKKLDAAYREAQEKSECCPVFLLFSVNTSGQFVGLAEMGGPVDFNKKVEYWQQDKWIGCFPVKWHIVKDVPNSLLKHITLENNDNKPVTNSRDTQEVKIQQGLEMLKIFKDYVSKTCIFDDFGFYEGRQKAMQERKAKLQPIQKQVPDGKPVDATSNEKHEDGSNLNARLPDSVLPKVANKEAIQGIGDRGPSEENDLIAGAGDAPKGAKPATEESLVDGIAKDC